MANWLKLSVACHVALLACLTRAGRSRDERGDVPGWVMITVMSAGLVVIIYGVAEGEVASMVRNALRSVNR